MRMRKDRAGDVPVAWIDPEPAERRTLVIWLPGFSGSKEKMEPYLRDLATAGFVALTYDPYQHGERMVETLDELRARIKGNIRRHFWPILARTAEDVSQVIDWAVERLGVSERVGMGGISAGGDASVAAAALDHRIEAVAAGIATPDFVTFASSGRDSIRFDEVRGRLGMPCFIKPANLGSSVGITKAHDAGEFEAGVREAFRYDRKILVEEYVNGREIECAVLGNARPEASGLGEVRPAHEFYSYEAKYIDEHGAELEIPAALPPELTERIRATAVEAHKVLACEGMSRVDFFLKEDGEVLVNELNTIPGFTRISMFPKLWEVAGVSYGDLIDRLIQLALERFDEEKSLET
jgi:hypothetical protein